MKRDEGRRSDYKGRKRAIAAALYLSGEWTIEEIANELDVTYSRAWKYLDDMQVKRRPPGRPRIRR